MKKPFRKPMISLFIALFFHCSSWAGLLFTYDKLALRDLDQMDTIIKQKIEESRKTKGDKTVPLKECLQTIYSRPNEDFMIEKIMGPLKTELDEYDAYEKVFPALVKEATSALKNDKAFNGKVLATYWIFLENVVAEMRPKATESFERSILVQIKNAKVEISRKAKDTRKLTVMKTANSPSDFAAEILAEAEKAAKAAPKPKK